MSPLLLIFIILAFIFLLLLSRTFSQSILHPIRIVVFFWAVTIIIPVLYWSKQLDFSGESYFWIAAFFLAMELGAVLCKGAKYNQPECVGIKKNVVDYETIKNWVLLELVVILGFISVAVTLVTNGVQISNVFTLDGILNTNAYYSSFRSAGLNVETSALSQILSLFIYFSAVCGGYCFNFANTFEKKKRIWSIVSILPAILVTLLTSGKSGTIASVFFWACAWCVSRLEIYGGLPKVSFVVIRRILIITITLIAFLYLAMLLRIGNFSAAARQLVFNKLYVYAFGQTLNFELWFSREARFLGDGFGYNTYMVIPHLLNIGERASGVYEVIAGSFGNVFTAFRGVIQDYGIIGGLLYGFIKGFITEYAYNRVAKENVFKGYISKGLLFAEYFWGFYAFIISAWIYTSYFLMPFAFGIFLIFFHRGVRVKVVIHARK